MTTSATTDQLPLCRALAAEPARHIFAMQLNSLLGILEPAKQQEREYRAFRIAGMLDAYFEAGLLDWEQFQSIGEELDAFVGRPLV